MTRYLTTDEAAEVVRKTRDYVARQCKAGAIQAKKLGNDWRISEDALNDFMGNSQPAPAARFRKTARQARRSP